MQIDFNIHGMYEGHDVMIVVYNEISYNFIYLIQLILMVRPVKKTRILPLILLDLLRIFMIRLHFKGTRKLSL